VRELRARILQRRGLRRELVRAWLMPRLLRRERDLSARQRERRMRNGRERLRGLRSSCRLHRCHLPDARQVRCRYLSDGVLRRDGHLPARKHGERVRKGGCVLRRVPVWRRVRRQRLPGVDVPRELPLRLLRSERRVPARHLCECLWHGHGRVRHMLARLPVLPGNVRRVGV